ncbi:MAG: molecular chaperone TorD family protein [Pseudomonadota bacterium]
MKFALIPLYKLMSLAFFYPEKTQWEKIEKQLPLCHELVAEDILSSLNRFIAQFYICREQIETLQSEYLRLFDVGHEVSPYETEYMTGKASRKPFELADIAGFYRAFGFDVGDGVPFKEAPDHISVELEFMAILSWKEEFARENQQEEALEIVRDARMKFFKEHLAQWGFFFCRKMPESGGDEFYKCLSALLRSVLISECSEYALDWTLFDRELNHDDYRGVRDEQLIC